MVLGDNLVNVGLDIGSGTLKYAVIDKKKIITGEPIPVSGHPLKAAQKAISQIRAKGDIEAIGITGTSGEEVAGFLGLQHIDEVTTALNTLKRIYPNTRSVIEIGRENSKYMQLRSSGKQIVVEEYNMNTRCAAGTGSFLDSKSKRSGRSLESFEEEASKSDKPAPIAGRCVVFAETDMVHHFQEGIPERDIIAGMYQALAKNFVAATIPKAADIKRPVLFFGGVSDSRLMQKFLKEELRRQRGIGLKSREFIVPEHNRALHAIGAAIGAQRLEPNVLDKLEHKEQEKQVSSWPELKLKKSKILPPPKINEHLGVQDAYLGLDVGSVSTKAAIIDSKGKVIASHYTYTKMNPAQAVKDLMKELHSRVGDDICIRGTATCGSGRFLNAVLIGANEIIDEISAQGLGCIAVYPKVDTIFEIGGQDSKYLKIEKGTLEAFEMNKECAAGTGSFLEEQCNALGILKKDGRPDLDRFGELALKAKRPVNTGERCTVFMESAVVQHQQNNIDVERICAGLCISVAQNYLNRVVEGKPIGKQIMFTGAVAKYKGLIAAFEMLTGKRITVPNECKLTGAIGAALAAKRRVEQTGEESAFHGFEKIQQSNVHLDTMVCEACPNMCRISSANIQRPDGSKDVYYTGDRCGKFSSKGKKKHVLPDYFADREKIMERIASSISEEIGAELGKRKVGMLRTMLHNDYYPLWSTFFQALGFEVVLSDRTNRKMIEDGVEAVSGEPCFPQKVSHGHMKNLLDKKLDFVFVPSMIETEGICGIEKSYACPYVQGTPYIFSSAFENEKMIVPKVNLKEDVVQALYDIGHQIGRDDEEIAYAYDLAKQAQKKFRKALLKRGKEVLKQYAGKEAYVLVARPYHMDSALVLDIWKRMQEDLGVPVLPMDYLPLDNYDIRKKHPNMYWTYGQKILQAAMAINDSYKKDWPKLRPVFITNFGCGPNSFIYPYFKEESDVPPIMISIDEHTAAAGIITRYQAGHRMRRQIGAMIQ